MTFLILMMGTLTIIMMMSEYIITANNVYINLNDFYDNFSIEAKIISEAKCIVANYGELKDFYIDEGYVSVEDLNGSYVLSFNDLSYKISIEDKMITYYEAY